MVLHGSRLVLLRGLSGKKESGGFELATLSTGRSTIRARPNLFWSSEINRLVPLVSGAPLSQPFYLRLDSLQFHFCSRDRRQSERLLAALDGDLTCDRWPALSHSSFGPEINSRWVHIDKFHAPKIPVPSTSLQPWDSIKSLRFAEDHFNNFGSDNS